MAAARKVSPAASTTLFCPSPCTRNASLADGRGFARSIHPNDQHNCQNARFFYLYWFLGLQQLHHLLLQDQVGILTAPNPLLLHPCARGFDEFDRSVHPDVGYDQRLLQLLPKFITDLVLLK